MEDLLRKYLPNASGLGLYVEPHIPPEMLRNAMADFGGGLEADDVLALYDATLLGSGKDGALFTRDRFVFQNTNLEAAQTILYEDLVRVTTKRKFLSGRKVFLDVNQGQATVTLTVDFSGKPEAAQYVTRFLHEAMMRAISEPDPATGAGHTDADAVIRALDELMQNNQLSLADYERLVDALEEPDAD